MFCKNCGAQINQGSAFCTNCGQKMPQQSASPHVPSPATPSVQAKPKKKANVPALIFAALSLLLAAALVVLLVVPGILSVSGSTSGIPSKGFDTPEAAIEYFIDCINKGDIEGALAVSFAGPAAANYDFEAMADRLQVVNMNMPLPSEYEFYRVFNETNFKNQLLGQIRGMVMSLTQPKYASAYLDGQMYMLDGEKADYEGVDPTLEEPIEIVKIEEPNTDMYDSDNHQKNMKRQAKAYGADSVEFRDVLYKYDGDYYAGGFIIIEYNEKFYIEAANEPFIRQSAYGALIPLDNKSDFDNLIE